MYQYIDGLLAYDLFNNVAIVVTVISSFFLVKAKTKALGVYSKYALFYASKKSVNERKKMEHLLAFIELFILTAISIISALFNKPFGNLVGTGVNYFGSVYSLLLFGFIFSMLIMANPMEQMDIITLLLPGRLFFLKIACFCQGCCWGVEWKYGLYNHHQHHPGTQVPVQAIEAILALAIFIFLLVYRRKAKTGTMYPMYLILYSATRFPVEFLSAAHEKVVGPFNTYHFLCVIGVVIGILMMFFVKHFGEKINDFFEIPHKKLDAKIAKYEEEKAQNIAAETAERLEKAKLARAKAKARKK